jgi:hypothetical protein
LFALERIVKKATIDHRDQSVALDVRRKLKIAVRFADVPLLLELGGGLAVICDKKAVRGA